MTNTFKALRKICWRKVGYSFNWLTTTNLSYIVQNGRTVWGFVVTLLSYRYITHLGMLDHLFISLENFIKSTVWNFFLFHFIIECFVELLTQLKILIIKNNNNFMYSPRCEATMRIFWANIYKVSLKIFSYHNVHIRYKEKGWNSCRNTTWLVPTLCFFRNHVWIALQYVIRSRSLPKW